MQCLKAFCEAVYLPKLNGVAISDGLCQAAALLSHQSPVNALRRSACEPAACLKRVRRVVCLVPDVYAALRPQSGEPLLLQRKACQPDEYDAAQEARLQKCFQSVATAHAKTFPNSLPTAQTGTFCEACPLKVRKNRKGLRT